MVPLQCPSLRCHVLIPVTGRAPDSFGTKADTTDSLPNVFLKLHKEQTLFYFLLQS